MAQQQLPERTYQSNNKLRIRNGVDFFMLSDTAKFAQFVLRVCQLVQEPYFPAPNQSRYGIKIEIILIFHCNLI